MIKRQRMTKAQRRNRMLERRYLNRAILRAVRDIDFPWQCKIGEARQAEICGLVMALGRIK